MYNIVFTLSLLAASALAAPECPPPGSLYFLIPHESDCSKFYICSHGTPVLQTCPEGTHFSPNFRVCQNPAFAGCDKSPPASELPCPLPDRIVFHPHPEICSKYYVCEHGSSTVFDCPHGLEFSAELRECVWPYESNCKNSQAAATQESQDVQDGGSQDGCQSGALSRHEECNKFYICDHGANVAMDCASGLQWSSKLEQCVWPSESDCGSQDGAQNDAQNGADQNGAEQNGGYCEDGTLSSNEDCSKFNICDHGAFVAKVCPKGLQWSSELLQCVWPSESDCGSQDGAQNDAQNGADQNGGQCKDGALSSNEDCSKFNICDHGAFVAKECPAGLQWSSELLQCVWPHKSDCGTQDGTQNEENGGEDNGQCDEGALSANTDCGKYNICNHGALMAVDCPAGLHWNSEYSYCDWPVSAGCQK